jgi:hypothetical protein
VKLLAPATGAPGLLLSLLLIALLLGPSLAGGFWLAGGFCAKAVPAVSESTIATRGVRRIFGFLRFPPGTVNAQFVGKFQEIVTHNIGAAPSVLLFVPLLEERRCHRLSTERNI